MVGFPEANERYVEAAEHSLAVVARRDGREVGVLTLIRHWAAAAEIDAMAVAREHHQRGIGRAMLARAEQLLARDGAEFLQVKTLSARADCEPYARTRAFYQACGFQVLQELPDPWDEENPALVLIKHIACRP